MLIKYQQKCISWQKTLIIFCSLITSSCILKASSRGTQSNTPAARPRLIVLIIIDQMRADLLDRFSDAFRKNSETNAREGLDKFKTEGTSFVAARTASAPTVTAAGHATVCSGAHAAKHGIVGNAYFDRSKRETVESASDETTTLVRTPGLLPSDPLSNVPSPGSSERRILVPNIADSLFEWNHASRIVSISIKDRGAVFCGGSHSKGVYWYDYKSGSMVTSSRYTNSLPSWVNQFNTNRAPNFSYTWAPKFAPEIMKTLLKEEKYRQALAIRSSLSSHFGGGFPYRYSSSEIGALGARKFFEFTPYASEHLVNFALEAQKRERLGCASREANRECTAPETPDLLTISFSTPDLVGHSFGPESLELFDVYINLNKSIEKLRKELESELGGGSVLFVQSADHGVQNMPEVTASASGKKVGRISNTRLKTKFEQVLEKIFGPGPWIDELITNEIYLNEETLKTRKVDRSLAIETLKPQVLNEPGLRGILTREDILKGGSKESEFFKRGHHIARSGDAVLLVEPGWLGEDSVAGNHGTSNDDDARIPMVFYGWKISRGQTLSNPVQADDIGPTILELIGAPRGSQMTGISRAALLINHAQPQSN